MKKLILIILLGFGFLLNAQQKPAFWDDIQNFKKIDRETPPKKGSILFVGSSSFTMWQDVNNYFPGKNIINRGFGGSTLLDLNFYSAELLKPYQPRQIVVYCGENDFASNEALKPRKAFNRFKNFYSEIRKLYPATPVAYVSTKLSPSREKLWPKFIATNALIKNYLSKKQNAVYIDITKPMNGADGRVRSDLFLDDQLHMKPEGYQIWAKQIAPYLK